MRAATTSALSCERDNSRCSSSRVDGGKIKIETKIVEKEKIVAEKLNGRFAMLGFIALVGAYLTTGQIIPGFI